MQVVNKVNKTGEMTLLEIVKYQIITYCYFKEIAISDAAALCLAHLAIYGEVELSTFCKGMADKGIFATPQVVRNLIGKSEENLVIKEGKKKIISINPDLALVVSGTILLDFKFLRREPTQS